MNHELNPIIGNWYRNAAGQSFEVVAVDESDETVEIQYYDGEVEELDFETWAAHELEEIAPPEDWSGPFDDLEKDDLGYSDQTGPSIDWSNPLDHVD